MDHAMIVSKFGLRLRTMRAASWPDHGMLKMEEGFEAAVAGYRKRKAEFDSDASNEQLQTASAVRSE